MTFEDKILSSLFKVLHLLFYSYDFWKGVTKIWLSFCFLKILLNKKLFGSFILLPFVWTEKTVSSIFLKNESFKISLFYVWLILIFFSLGLDIRGVSVVDIFDGSGLSVIVFIYYV